MNKRTNKLATCILFSGLMVLTAIFIPAFALQRPQSSNITISVIVQGSFNIMVSTDSFDFARLMPGQTGESSRKEGILVAGTSTSGNPWYLKVTASNPLTSGSDIIPNDNFTWYGTSEGQGNWFGGKEKNFSDQNNTAYVSSADEVDLGKMVANKFKFKLHVPEDTKPGVYTTTVMFTMTE